jgi:hypothetical protein
MAKASYVWDGTQWINFGTAGSIGPPASIAVGTVTTSAAGGSAVVTNVGTSSAAIFDFTLPRGNTGPTGSAATIAVGTVTTGSAGSSASVTNSGTSGAATFDFTIPRGDTGATGATGAAATIAVGTVTTGSAGSSASVTNVGTSGAATLNFTIPRGDTGITGTAATIAVGTVTTGAAGSSATVTNVGTSSAATFDFSIPRGDTGLTGSTGATGAGYAGTSSTTSLAIATGSKAFTVGSVGAFVVGMRVRASSSSTPASYMEGGITSIASSVITVNVDAIGGTGTLNDWVFGVAGSLGAGAYYQPTAPSSPLAGYLWVDSSQTLSTYTNVYTQAQVDALLLALQNSLSTTSDQLILANRIFS